jgi:uncharacterized protein (TIGR02145 family)
MRAAFQSFAIILLAGCHSVTAQHQFIDKRDNHKYETFQEGQHIWFKENLKFKTPTSWCSENPQSEACLRGNYYYPTDLINVCPSGWRVPTWAEYKEAILSYHMRLVAGDSVKFVKSKLPMYKNLSLDGELVTGLTLIGDTSFFDMTTTGWIQGDEWQAEKETTMWIVHDISNTPQPHIHVRANEVVMHSHGHNVLDKPKKLRRFSVRCISDISSK